MIKWLKTPFLDFSHFFSKTNFNDKTTQQKRAKISFSPLFH
nr:MAG TPA: hypothetical protein [Caudoviricetes sp.]